MILKLKYVYSFLRKKKSRSSNFINSILNDLIVERRKEFLRLENEKPRLAKERVFYLFIYF